MLRIYVFLVRWGLLVSSVITTFYLLPSFELTGLIHWPHRIFFFSPPYDNNFADFHAYKKSWTRPDVHLLIDARVRDLGLCKTLLSAVIQGYPPPILVGYHSNIHQGDTLRLFENIRATIIKPPTGGNDLVVWLGRNTWAQLPVGITIRRYLQYADVLADSRDRQYPGVRRRVNETSVGLESPSKQSHLILFPATKICLYNCDGDDIWPESSLHRDVYGHGLEQQQCTDNKRPRYLSPGAFIGRAYDVVGALTDLIRQRDNNSHNASQMNIVDEQQAWSSRYYMQELHRKVERRQFSTRHFWNILRVLLRPANALLNPNISTPLDITATNHNCHLTLDYESRIFQSLHHSLADVRFLVHNHSHPDFPPELHHQPPLLNTSNTPPTLLWHDLPLLTNTRVPHSSIPSLLSLHETPHLLDVWWTEMWFYPHARELLRKYRFPGRGKIAREAEEGGVEWWNLRGGSGGFWTDKGAWVSWEGVCGGCEDGLFGGVKEDGRHDGLDKEDDGGKDGKEKEGK